MVMELLGTDGVLLRRDVVSAGYSDKQLRRLVMAGAVTRVRQGAYASRDHWQSLDKVGQHRLLCAAVMRQYDDGIALSHASAVIDFQGPSHGLDLSQVHVTHLATDTGRRNVAGVVHHKGTCLVDDISRSGRAWITSPGRTVIDIALLYGFEIGVVVADDFLRRRLTTKPELWRVYEPMKDWSGALVVRMVIAWSDPRSESVGETLGRLLFRRLGLPAPDLQYEVWRPDGSLAGRTDWAWPERRVLGEFDGLAKYGRWLKPGEDAADAVLREKRREDELRELTGWTFIRLVWTDLFRGERTASRLRNVLRLAA